MAKTPIQSYLEQPEYDKLKAIADKKGLSLASLVRVILLEYLENKK